MRRIWENPTSIDSPSLYSGETSTVPRAVEKAAWIGVAAGSVKGVRATPIALQEYSMAITVLYRRRPDQDTPGTRALQI